MDFNSDLLLFGPYVLMEPIKELKEDDLLKSDGGVYLLTNPIQESFGKGRVIAISQHPDLDDLNLKVGDLVYFLKSHGGNYIWEGQPVIYLHAQHLVGKYLE